MRHCRKPLALLCAAGAIGWAARCTTSAPPGLLHAYEGYVGTAEESMDRRFAAGELAWLPNSEARDGALRLAAGQLVRSNLSDAALNDRLSGQNGTLIHWIGALSIPGATLADVKSVLEDYDHYARIYQALIFDCKALRSSDATRTAYDLTLGLHSAFRVASVFPQHYAFRVKARMDFAPATAASFGVHMGANEIRESDSGVPGRSDLLEPYHDHGIMWALNAYWRVRQAGSGVYLEFETITLARSVQEFACKIGFVPVPKSIVASAMESLPAD
jgi:hypothetical protein